MPVNSLQKRRRTTGALSPSERRRKQRNCRPFGCAIFQQTHQITVLQIIRVRLHTRPSLD
ncbi:hypothetical protein M413DRAFT_139877 [Hebeloma cylindrosporum]|uniref:Uncharacterized protein n=1 Tax=Hebeloma cylindrosporum TaxID=76867 RepID=A0A0C3CE35_HEBCY|nr:hypothetical protein M413DRAFT_139877 [Hebeloma cylindrosporum h7]